MVQTFCRRYRLSFRKKRHTADKLPAHSQRAIEIFHAKLLRGGTFSLSDRANMDQTPLPFVMDDGKTYNRTGAKEVWCASGASGLPVHRTAYNFC